MTLASSIAPLSDKVGYGGTTAAGDSGTTTATATASFTGETTVPALDYVNVSVTITLTNADATGLKNTDFGTVTVLNEAGTEVDSENVTGKVTKVTSANENKISVTVKVNNNTDNEHEFKNEEAHML